MAFSVSLSYLLKASVFLQPTRVPAYLPLSFLLCRTPEFHSHFHYAGFARPQGQGKEGVLLLFIWWGVGEAFVFLCVFLLAADLAASIRLTCMVTISPGKIQHLKD